MAEKDDWVPRKDGPYIWLNHEPTKARSHVVDAAPTHPEEAGPKEDAISKSTAPSLPASSAGSDESLKSINESTEDPPSPTEASHEQSRLAETASPPHLDATDEPRKPLLATEKLQEGATSESRAGSPLYTSLRAAIPAGEQQQVLSAAAASVGDDAKRKSGRQSRMMDLGKKMGDKLEEKRRQVEEKGRHIVEKMRENARTNSMERTTSA